MLEDIQRARGMLDSSSSTTPKPPIIIQHNGTCVRVVRIAVSS